MNAGRAVCLVLVALLMSATSVSAQTRWWIPSTVGYGGAALGLSWVVEELGGCDPADADCFEDAEFFEAPGAFLLSGVLVGYAVGKVADGRLRRGEELTAGHRNALRAGVALTGGTLAAIAAAIFINGTQYGHDEVVFISAVAAGTAGGLILQRTRHEAKLRPRVEAVGLGPDGRVRVLLALRL